MYPGNKDSLLLLLLLLFLFLLLFVPLERRSLIAVLLLSSSPQSPGTREQDSFLAMLSNRFARESRGGVSSDKGMVRLFLLPPSLAISLPSLDLPLDLPLELPVELPLDLDTSFSRLGEGVRS